MRINYELMGGATVRTCSLPSDGIPVWAGVAPKCELKSKNFANKIFLRHKLESIRQIVVVNHASNSLEDPFFF